MVLSSKLFLKFITAVFLLEGYTFNLLNKNLSYSVSFQKVFLLEDFKDFSKEIRPILTKNWEKNGHLINIFKMLVDKLQTFSVLCS